jgi:hypothetical protein
MSDLSSKALMTASVGAGGKNRPDDVRAVEYLLNVTMKAGLPESGRCDESLVAAIGQFQVTALGFKHGDGRVDPVGRTMNGLLDRARRDSATGASDADSHDAAHRTMVRAYLHDTAESAAPVAQGASIVTGLTEADFAAAAEALGPGIQVAMIRAFAEVESGGRSGFGPDFLPKIAFEGHHFRKFTKQKFDASHPHLSHQYERKAGSQWHVSNATHTTAWATLNEASALDRSAALQSCSWGMFQIMGFNYGACGSPSAEAFVDKMKAGARGQFDAFIAFCKSVPGLRNAMATKDFVGCASRYNGKDYGNYDRLLESAFKKHGGV